MTFEGAWGVLGADNNCSLFAVVALVLAAWFDLLNEDSFCWIRWLVFWTSCIVGWWGVVLRLELDDWVLIEGDIDEINNGGAALTAYGLTQYTNMSNEERNKLKASLIIWCPSYPLKLWKTTGKYLLA